MTHITIKNKSYSIPELILFILLALEFAFVVYCNLALTPATLDNDAAKVFTHAIEMWNNKTIFIPHWVNETMLELDTALIFAVPLYALTGDIIISFGLSNIIILLMFYFFMSSILKRMGESLSTVLISCALITIPYSFGQLLYFDMMFFSGAFYGIKILLPFMIIYLLTDPAGQSLNPRTKRGPLFYIVFVLSVIFSLLFSISSGPYTLLCVIAPITVCYIWIAFGKMNTVKDIFSKWLISFDSIILYVEILAALIGIVIGIIGNVDSSGSSMGVIEYGDFTDNFLWIIEGFVEMAGATPYESVDLLSPAGITALSHYAIALIAIVCFIALFITGFKRVFMGREMERSGDSVCSDDPECSGDFLCGGNPECSGDSGVMYNRHLGYNYLYVMFAWNLMVVIVCPIGINCRYELMSIISAIPLMTILMRGFILSIKGSLRRTICRFVLSALFVVVALTSDYRVLQDDCRPAMAANNTKYEHVIEILHSLPENQIFLLDDEGRAEVLRVLDHKSGKEYLAYMFCDKGVSVHDYYASHTDASFFEDDHILIVDEYVTDFNDLPAYISSLYEEIDNYQGVHIYRASVNKMDGAAGYENNAHSIDYFYTNGYEITNGTISDADGSLEVVGNGEVAVTSPRMANNAKTLDIVVEYSLMQGSAAGNSDSDINSDGLIAKVSDSTGSSDGNADSNAGGSGDADSNTDGDGALGTVALLDSESGALLAEGAIKAADTRLLLTDIDVSGAHNVILKITVAGGAAVKLERVEYTAR